MKTPSDVKSAYIAYLKSKPSITSLLTDVDEIRELEWQGQAFVYPNIRVSVDFLPAVNRCLDTAEVEINIFSEQKSSSQASDIASAIYTLLHGHPFEQDGTKFPIVVVTKITKPDATIFGWNSMVSVRSRVA
jgi:tRNA U38,U39,U40 pseudouridine synthase TruA